MMRLPKFRYLGAKSLKEALQALGSVGPEGRAVAGGTDLLPNMKRRQQQPKLLVGLRQVPELQSLSGESGGSLGLGACLTLSEIAGNAALQDDYAALSLAARAVATPALRNMGTLGGNLCLDTRCNYYCQDQEWREALGYCMKKDGSICWVAPSSPRCWAVSSCDTAPAAIALGARVRLASASGRREIDLSDLYLDDGIRYLSLEPGELVEGILLPPAQGWVSTYRKIRRRGSIDFPILSVAAALKLDGGVVEKARIVFGAVGSRPKQAKEAAAFLGGERLTAESIEEAARLAAKAARPLDNTDGGLSWRKRIAQATVVRALEEILRG